MKSMNTVLRSILNFMQKSSDGGIKMKERTYVDDVDRSVYDIKDEEMMPTVSNQVLMPQS